VAEYAHAYGRVPLDTEPWHQVMALVSRTGRFEVRERLVVAAGMADGQPVHPDYAPIRAMEHEKLAKMAYPWGT
jgi:hypothetical protein